MVEKEVSGRMPGHDKPQWQSELDLDSSSVPAASVEVETDRVTERSKYRLAAAEKELAGSQYRLSGLEREAESNGHVSFVLKHLDATALARVELPSRRRRRRRATREVDT